MAASRNEGKEDWKELWKKEIECIEQAEVGNPEKSFACTGVLKEELVECFNKCITLKKNCAAICDSAASYFGRDNVGLPGIALHFRVSAVADHAAAAKTIAFLNARGAPVCFEETCAPPSHKDWFEKDRCATTVAFIKQLALAKIAYKKANAMWAKAIKLEDGHSALFLAEEMCQLGEVIGCLSKDVTELTLAEKTKDVAMVKCFDTKKACIVQSFAKAAAIEAVVPPRLQLGTVLREKLCLAKAVEGSCSWEEYAKAKEAWMRGAA